MMRGLRLAWKKESSLIAWTIRRPAIPSQIRIFLRQGGAPACHPCVQPGDYVRTGEKIASSASPQSSALHASISGRVTGIKTFFYPHGGEAEAIEIQSDGKDEKITGLGEERKGWEELGAGELKKLILESGVVQMGETMTPLFNSNPQGKKAKTLLLNGCESEPYVTSAYSLMMSHPLEILKGAELFRKALGAEKILCVFENDKLEAAELIKSKVYFLKWKHIETRILPVLYPQDHAAVLARQFSGEDEGKIPSSLKVIDVAGAYAIWEAVARQKPLYERAMTVGGECVIEPKNFWVRTGTDLETLFKFAKGLLRQPEKVILGGPMRGRAQTLLDIPVLKENTALLALPKEITGGGFEEPCIRCGRCVEVCPADISPVMITLSAEKGLWDLARDYDAASCIECGNCGYVCPSKRPMLELIRRIPSRTA